MGGGGITRGARTNSRGGQEASAPEKKRGTTRCGGETRGGQMDALPERQEATQQPAWADKRHESKDRDLAELEARMG
jgi:hypothetical protein